MVFLQRPRQGLRAFEGRPLQQRIPAGFTLLEILIAIFILVTVLSTVFASYTGTFRIVEETEAQAEVYQMARTALERISQDLESAYTPQEAAAGFTGPAEMEEAEESFTFSGEEDEIAGRSADSMRFLSRAHLVFGEQDLPCEIAEISYYVEEDDSTESLILYRRDILRMEEKPEEGEGGLPLCKRLAAVDFTYYDSRDEEHEGWDPSEQGMPKMVSVALEFVNPSNPEGSLKFATSVALPMRGQGQGPSRGF